MERTARIALTAFLCAWCLAAAKAQAVIRVDMPLSQILKTSQQVLISKLESLDASANKASLVETVTLEELGKKVLMPRDRGLTLDLEGDKKLAGRLKPGAPVVIFVGRRGAAVHVADTWYKAEPADKGWSIAGPYDIAASFPGSTPSLVRALLKIRAGQAPMVDAVMHHTWDKDFKLQTLDVNAKAMASADANADHKADLAVVVAEGAVRFYLGTGPGKAFTDATAQWKLAAATARRIAFADANGDGKPDLLLDELYLNAGSSFVPCKAGINLKGQDVLAVSLMDATGDGKTDALVLTTDGMLTVYRNPGQDAAWPKDANKAIWKGGEKAFAAHIGDWGDDGTPHVMVVRASGLTRYSMSGDAADFKRLTGKDEPQLNSKPRFFPMNDFLASAAWDRSGGDGNLDLLIATRRGKPYDLELVGRGHGAFFFNTEGGVGIKSAGSAGRVRARPARAVAMAPADMYGDGSFEMLVLEEDGTLWQKDSPVYVRGAPIGASGAK